MSQDSECIMTPSAAAFSTMLTAFVGSIIGGLSSGPFIALHTGWIAWFPCFRIIAAGLYELYLTFKFGSDIVAVDKMDHDIPMNRIIPGTTATAQTNAQEIQQSVTALGWVGWMWSAIYTPISQTIWVCVHLNSSTPGPNQLVRAIAIGVSALGLTFDYKARYAAALGRGLGSWAFIAFNAWNASACLLLGAETLALLVSSAMDNIPIPLVAIYPVFCVIWAIFSWCVVPPIDGARSGNAFAGVIFGAFAGLFVAAPAFALWQNASFNEEVAKLMGDDAPEGVSLGEYLSCKGVSLAAKFAAVMP